MGGDGNNIDRARIRGGCGYQHGRRRGTAPPCGGRLGGEDSRAGLRCLRRSIRTGTGTGTGTSTGRSRSSCRASRAPTRPTSRGGRQGTRALGLGLGDAAARRDGREAGRGPRQELLDIGARVRVDDIGAGGGIAGIDRLEIGYKELRVGVDPGDQGEVTVEEIPSGLAGAAGGDDDWGAVHVVLGLAGQLGDPSPGE